MIDINQKKEKIISFIQKNGPSLPVRIAKEIQMEPIFASAILSELLGTKKIKMSNLKVGSSSLYLLPGQEKMLEDHTDNLKSIEKEAYLKLKKEKILEDEKEEPQIRVALRGIKDFATPFEKEGKTFWKYTFDSEEEKKKEDIKQEESKESKEENIKQEEEKKKEKLEEEKDKKTNLEEPKEIKKEEQKEEEKKKEVQEKLNSKENNEKKLEEIFEEKIEKPEFFHEIKEFLEKNKITLKEEIKSEKKEILGKISFDSSVGELEFLLVAKNKLSVNKEEINSALQLSNHYKCPCLIIIRKEPKGQIKNYIEENKLIKILVM